MFFINKFTFQIYIPPQILQKDFFLLWVNIFNAILFLKKKIILFC